MFTKLVAWGWKKPLPMLPIIKNALSVYILLAKPNKGKNIEDKSSPKNIKNRFLQKSDKYPKMGCIRDEHMWDKLKIKVDAASVIPKLAAINGIIGFTKPE